MNDIQCCSSLLYFILYAGDTNLFYCNRNISTLLLVVNIELNKLSTWFCANKLTLNIKKSNFIMFGNKKLNKCHPNIKIMLNGNELEKVKNTKFLGVF